jgi:HK97 family phage major capsid protein
MNPLAKWRQVNDTPAQIAAFVNLADGDTQRAIRACRESLPSAMHAADIHRHRRAVTAFAKNLHNSGDKLTRDQSAAFDAALALVELFDAELEARDPKSARAEPGASSDFVDPATGRPLPVAYGTRGTMRAQLAPHMESTAGAECSALDFLRGVAGVGRTTETIRNAMSVGTDSAGGFSLPSHLQMGILDAMVPVSSLLTAGAGVVMLAEGSKSYRYAAVNAIPTASWRNEGAAIAESEPTFRAVDLVPRSLAFRFVVSRELLMDSMGLEQAATRVIAQAFAKELDRAGLRGTGTAPQIRGLLNTANVQAIGNGATGASLGTTAYANFISATNAILSADGPMPTAAIMSPRSLTILGGALDSTGQPRRVPPMLEPMRFIATSQVPNNLTVSTSTDCSEIYVGDFSQMAFFMRESMSITKLTEAHALTGEIGFTGHARVDVGVLYPAAFAVVTGVRA